MDGDWFEVVHGPSLEQGDLLPNCPIYRVETLVESEDSEAVVVLEEHDVIVLTQTCDLENKKVEDILVASVLSYPDLVARDGETKPDVKSTKFRKSAKDGNLPAYHLLPERLAEPALLWSLVDFHNLFSVSRGLATTVAEGLGDRLRLVPPYKEHFGQAFARYMMRVGLPTTLDEFEHFKA